MQGNSASFNRTLCSSRCNAEEIEPVDISVVIPYRHCEAYDDFLDFTLQALNGQSLPRNRFTVILTEQDIRPRVQDRVLPYVDRYIFGWSDHPFNRAWGLNMGFLNNSAPFYCCFDVDFVVDRDFLAHQLPRMRSGINVLRPYGSVRNLTQEETRIVLSDPSRLTMLPPSPSLPTRSVGGILIFHADFYRRVGGYVEEFEGWGYEDTLMARWAKKLGAWSEGEDIVFHLWHPPNGDKKRAISNKVICESYLCWTPEQIYARAARTPWGNPHRYRF